MWKNKRERRPHNIVLIPTSILLFPPPLPPLCGAEILTADKQLAEEIAFDLKRVEEEQKKAAKAAQTPLAATPHAQMVRGRHKDDCYVEVLYMYSIF